MTSLKKNTHVNSLTCHFKVNHCVSYSRISVSENKKNSPAIFKKKQKGRRGGERGEEVKQRKKKKYVSDRSIGELIKLVK